MTAFDWWIWPLVIYSLGALAALDALWQSRTAQGTIAWVLGLLLMPVIALPLYAFFGSRRLHGYLRARRHGDHKLSFIAEELATVMQPFAVATDTINQPLNSLFRLPMTRGNQCELLTSGEATYDSIFASIQQAQHYVCVQFYILRDDRIGEALADLLCQKAQAGIAVFLLYDEIGSHGLSQAFIHTLRDSGVRVSRFNPLQLRHRLQLNFRNHRKLVICDGETSFIGGYNIGEEYLGNEHQAWRDTHVKISGPATLAFQLAFFEDWHWATGYIPSVRNKPVRPDGNTEVMCIPTGPADETESASLYFSHLIHSARSRCWLVSPYFVPDQTLLSALQLAGLRGIDIRILLPEKTDNWLVQQAMHSYIAPLSQCNVRFYTYSKGFLHQKVILIDDKWASIGSANLDNRSLRINFEIGALIKDRDFAAQTARMLEQDFSVSYPTATPRHWWSLLLARTARLLAPIL